MTLTAHVRDGRIVSDDPVALPDGTPLRLRVFAEVERDRRADGDAPAPTLLDALAGVVGKVDDLPNDAASTVDRVLYRGNES